jgi:trigger factor
MPEKPLVPDSILQNIFQFSPFYSKIVDEYKADLQKKLQENADARDESLMKDRALEKLYEANEIEVPEVMIRNEIDNIIYDMNQNLATQGLGLQQYMEWTGKTIDDVREEAKPEAEKRVRTRILLKNLIRQENLEADAAEIENLMKEFGEQYGMTVDQVKEMAGAETENYFKEDAQTKKAIDFLFENAVLTEKKEEAEEK